MANTYEWIFDPIEVKQSGELANVANVIHWRLNGTSDDGFVTSIYGSVVLEDPDADDFVDFDSADFSKDLVKSWVIPLVGDGCTEDMLKKTVDDQMDIQRTPPTVQKKPGSW